jgi:hypothetical protein
MSREWRMLAFLAVVGGAGCAPFQYTFTPTEQVTATTDGVPAARYPVPPEMPRGTVYVTSFGVVQADVAGTGQKTPLLAVRLTVSHDEGPVPWTVDTREQLLQIPGAGKSRAAFVNSDVAGAPVIPVASGQKRTIDLYYALPPSMATGAKIPSFDLLWQVHTAERPVAQRTPFQKQTYELADVWTYPVFPMGPGWAPYWWYDPFYPAVTFYPPVVLHNTYPVLVGSSPPHPRVIATTPPSARPQSQQR